VIDDDPAILSVAELLLKRDGHDVVVAREAHKGLRALEAEPFDLVIVDIFMPEMDGLETINHVHRLRPGLPVIVMSGYQFEAAVAPRPDFLHMATALGATSSLKKPFRPADMLQAVAACLPRRAGQAAG
jgi:DNA-binding NtrC family response regulator